VAPGRGPGPVGGGVEWEGIGRGPRSPAGAAGRSAGQWTTIGRPDHRVLTLASRRLGCGGGDGEGRGRVEDGSGPVPAMGPRRPEGAAMELERLVVIWCPELQQEGARGEEARRFVQVVARAGELCPWVIRSGSGSAPCPRAGRPASSAERRWLCPAWSKPWERTPRRRGRRALRRDSGRPLPADRPGGGGGASFWRPGRWPPWPGPSWPSPCSGSGSPRWDSSPPCPPPTSRTVSGPTRPPVTAWPGARAGSWPGARSGHRASAAGGPG
jgi:hypothetical protein